MKFPKIPALFFIGLLAFAPTLFNGSDSNKAVVSSVKDLFGDRSKDVEIDVLAAQEGVKDLVIVRSNDLRYQANATNNAKEFLVNRLFRLSAEFDKLAKKHTSVTPGNSKGFKAYQGLVIDYLGTIYAIEFIANGKYPDSVDEGKTALSGIPIDSSVSMKAIQAYSKKDGVDYLSKFTKGDQK